MPDNQSHTEQGQIERAKRLRDHIERLKHGEPEPIPSKKEKSLKEQIADRSIEKNQYS
ncbi:MAG TPA: hypothetical protein VMG82_33725 [Candidatus Sulfotelmatobacter sp.]|nr:hypothetical protein [Candidatus Sulfotelmatobacter sp.]